MSAKHTPGPWSWGSDYNGLYGAGPDNDVLSTAYYENMWLSHKRDEAEREANARLIAAAPELLEALIAVKEVLDFAIGADLVPPHADGPAAMAARAIAKATGSAS